MNKEIIQFVNFQLKKNIYNYKAKKIDKYINFAFGQTCDDYLSIFNKLKLKKSQIADWVINNHLGALQVFFYRLAREFHQNKIDDYFKYHIHFLMKLLTSSEIYWTTKIGKGFVANHGNIIIGSKCTIGKNFVIYQGCTIGASTKFENLYSTKGPKIGDNVVLYPNSVITGDITIGNNVVIAPNEVVRKNLPSNCIFLNNQIKKK